MSGQGDDAVLALLPRVIHRDLLKGRQCASLTSHRGALLFVDIAGFSSVASQLQRIQSDGEGAETLTHHLNQYFGMLIQIVHAHSGDIIFFSGDAMMVAWDGNLEIASAASVLCAASLLTDAREYTFTLTGCGTPISCTMRLHIGAAGGDYCGMTVGGRGSPHLGKWKYLVTGLPVELAGIAAAEGKVSEFVMTDGVRDAAAAAGVGCRTSTFAHFYRLQQWELHLFEELLQDAPREKILKEAAAIAPPDAPKLTKQARDVASLYVFDTVVNAVESGSLAGALRTVCTVFIKLTSIDIDLPPAEMHSKLNSAVGTIQKHLVEFDGVLNKVMMDDKGMICLCLFGIPMHGHSNDAYRGVMFAMKAAKRLEKNDNIISSMGISMAPVFCGMTGSPSRHEYTVLGDGVNLAARLMCKAADFDPTSPAVMTEPNVTSSKDIDMLGSNGLATVNGEFLVLKGQDAPVMCIHVIRETERDRVLGKILGEEMSDASSGGSVVSFSSRSSRAPSIASCVSLESTKALKTRSATAHILNAAKEMAANRSILCSDPPGDASEKEDPESPAVAMRKGLERSGGQSPPAHGGGTEPFSDNSHRSRKSDCHSPVKGHGLGDCPTSPPMRSPRKRGNKAHSHGKVRERVSIDEDFMEANSADPCAEERILGRASEMQTIRSRVTAWMQGEAASEGPGGGRAVMLLGEAKLGKSFLLRCVLAELGVTHILATCTESQAASQFNCVRAVLQRMLLETDLLSLSSDLEPSLADAAGMLHFVLRTFELPGPDDSLLELSSAERLALINRVAIALLKAHYGKVLICIDDLQWTDEASVTFLQEIASDPAFFLLGAIRQDILKTPHLPVVHDERMSESTLSTVDSDEPYSLVFNSNLYEGDVAKAVKAHTVQLAPLPYDVVVDLIRQSRDCTEVEARLAKSIFDKSDGLPGYVLDMTSALVNASLVSKNIAGKLHSHLECDVDTHLAQVVPATMEASVMRIVDRLSTAQRNTASIAAVLGRSAPKTLLLDCLKLVDIPADSAVAAIASLCEMGLLAQEDRRKQRTATKKMMLPGGLPGSGSRNSLSSLSPKSSAARLTGSEGDVGHDTTSRSKCDTRVYFVRSTIRDAIYNTILTRERRRLHSVASQVIMKTPNPLLSSLVHHFRMAEDLAAGWRFLQAQYGAHVTQGDYREGSRILAELVTYDPHAAAPLGPLPPKGFPFALTPPSDFSKAEWLLWLCLCLYESGQLAACAMNSVLLKELPPDPPEGDSGFSVEDFIAAQGQDSGHLTREMSKRSSQQSLTKQLSLRRSVSHGSFVARKGVNTKKSLLVKHSAHPKKKQADEPHSGSGSGPRGDVSGQHPLRQEPGPRGKSRGTKDKAKGKGKGKGKHAQRKKAAKSSLFCCCGGGGADSTDAEADALKGKYKMGHGKGHGQRHGHSSSDDDDPPPRPKQKPPAAAAAVTRHSSGKASRLAWDNQSAPVSCSSDGSSNDAHAMAAEAEAESGAEAGAGAGADGVPSSRDSPVAVAVQRGLSLVSTSHSDSITADCDGLYASQSEFIDDGRFVWCQLCMLRCELLFFTSPAEMDQMVEVLIESAGDKIPLQTTRYAIDTLAMKDHSAPPPHARAMFHSPFAIMALAARPDALRLLQVADHDLSLLHADAVNLLPLQRVAAATPTRPSCVTVLLICRSILKAFAGDGAGAFEDCARVKSHRLSDERSVMYACIVRSLLSLWYPEKLMPRHEQQWKDITTYDVSACLMQVPPLLGDTLLHMLFAVRDGSPVAEHLLVQGSRYTSPYHILGVCMLLEECRPGSTGHASKMLDLLDAASQKFPFARPAHHFYRAVICKEPSGFVDTIEAFLSSDVAPNAALDKESRFISPYAFRAAAQLVDAGMAAATQATTDLLDRLVTLYDDEVDGPIGSRLLQIGLQRFHSLPEMALLYRVKWDA